MLIRENFIDALVSTGTTHLWYLYALIYIYLFAPFIAKAVSVMSNKQIVILVFLLVFFDQFRHSWPVFSREYFNFSFVNNIAQFGNTTVSSGTGYFAYFILGYLLIARNALFMQLKRSSLYALSLVLIIAPILLSVFYQAKYGANRNLSWYNTSITIFTSSIGVFLLLRLLFEYSAPNKMLNALANGSFGIYLMHFIVLYSLNITLTYYGVKINIYLLSVIYTVLGTFLSY